MRIQSRSRFVLLAGLSMASLAWLHSTTIAAEPVFSRVSFPSCDGLELSGTFYPAGAGKKDKDAVVLLLHEFDPRKGGGSHGEWDKLAARLQEEGYAVLSFDFRGFGQSKTVRDEFWNFRHNQLGIPRGFKGKGGKSAESIDQKDFTIPYYQFMVNDIVAAKAFMDRKNDSRELNSSNVLLVGAGDGATLGALWMAAEMHRQKDTSPPTLIPQPPVRLDDPEGKDLAGAVWLTISPNIAGKSVSKPLSAALVETARENKVPTVLVFGGNDTSGTNVAKNYMDAIESGKKIDPKLTGKKTIANTDLIGSKLIGTRGTADFIVKQLDRVMEDRGSKEWKKRDETKSRFFWSRGKGNYRLAKTAGEKVARPIPPELIRLTN